MLLVWGGDAAPANNGDTMTTPNPAAVAAAITDQVADYLAARALSEVLAEQVAGIASELLSDMVVLDDDGERITAPDDAWLCRDEDSAAYYAELEARTNAAIPHDLPAGHCPALNAASVMRDAEEALLQAMGPLLGFGGITIHRLDLRRKMIDNGVGLVLAVERETSRAA